MILKNYPCNQPYLSGVHMLGPGHTLPHVTLPPIKWWVFRLCLAHRDIVQQAAPDSIWVRMCLHLVFHINIVIWPTLSMKQIFTPKAEWCTIINICQNRWGPCEHMNTLKSNEEPQAWEFIDYSRPQKEGKKPNTVMTKTPRNLSSDYLMWISR